MAFYTNFDKAQLEDTVDINMDELLEAFYYDDHYSDSDYEKQQLLENLDYLEESKKKKLSTKTIVKLNKNDDLSRRVNMAALQIAKDKNDPAWKKLVAVRVQERKLLGIINKRFNTQATQVAKVAQKEYIKGNQNVKKMTPKDLSSTRV